MKVMLLAAGEGRRMRPLTDTLPKPLLPLAGSTLIERWIDRFIAIGISEFVINTWHMQDVLTGAVGDGKDRNVSIVYSREPYLMETGGGIRHALPLLGEGDFIVVSADIACDYDLGCLPESLPDGILGHLVMVDNPDHHPGGDFAIAADGKLTSHGRCLTYTGIGVFSPALFRDAPEGAFKLRLLLDDAITAGRLSGSYCRSYWQDVGTIDRYRSVLRRYGGGEDAS